MHGAISGVMVRTISSYLLADSNRLSKVPAIIQVCEQAAGPNTVTHKASDGRVKSPAEDCGSISMYEEHWAFIHRQPSNTLCVWGMFGHAPFLS